MHCSQLARLHLCGTRRVIRAFVGRALRIGFRATGHWWFRYGLERFEEPLREYRNRDPSNNSKKQVFTLRALGFLNHASIGKYDEANYTFVSGQSSVPDLASTMRSGRTRGSGLNGESVLPYGARAFGRC